MYHKVTLVKGKGGVKCNLPSFRLAEGGRETAITRSRSKQMEDLEKMGCITIVNLSEADYEVEVQKLSAALRVKSAANRVATLKNLKETGGKEDIMISPEVKGTSEPADGNIEEVKAEAAEGLPGAEQDLAEAKKEAAVINKAANAKANLAKIKEAKSAKAAAKADAEADDDKVSDDKE